MNRRTSMKYFFVLFSFLLSGVVYGQGVVKKPAPSDARLLTSADDKKTEDDKSEVKNNDPELKNLQWNRYATKNFTILSIDDDKGKKLSENIEFIKDKCLTRWGFPDVKFSKECRIFCVPNYDLLRKLFNLTASKTQLRKDLNVIWLVLDDDLLKSVEPYVTLVAFNEYEIEENTTLPLWFKRGAFVLNNDTEVVRQNLKSFYDSARKESFSHNAEQMFSFTDEEYNKQNVEGKRIFDMQAAYLALLLRKEFGEVKLQGFLRLQSKNKVDSVLQVVYGFKNYDQFDKNYVQFMKDLGARLNDSKVPDSYLTVTAVQ